MAITHSKGVPYGDITVDRDQRQRTTLTGIEELAASIARIGLLQPIVLDKSNKLVAGERRYTAWGLLFRDNPDKWAKIPARYLSELAPSELALVELEENIKRHNLSWEDECRAVLKFHELMVSTHEKWTYENSVENLNVSASHFNKQVTVGKELAAGNPKLKGCDGFVQAYNIIKRDNDRKLADALNQLSDEMREFRDERKSATQAGEPTTVTLEDLDLGEDGDTEGSIGLSGDIFSDLPLGDATPRVSVVAPRAGDTEEVPEPEPILNVDFTEWVKTYEGKRFNLLHCDLPYGINHQDSDQGGAERWGAYEDTPDVYFHLCQTITDNLDKLLYPSAHVLFWFSMTHYEWTKEHFTKAGLVVNPFPLVWHKTDNKGLLPDYTRGPRRVYETAFLMSRGDRKIVEVVGNAYGAPTAKSSALHLSEKPVPVLDHFMRMLVDDYTEMLDPTCGGGSALRAAERRRAKRVVGLERDPEFARLANVALKTDRGMRRVSAKVKESSDG